ILVAAWRRLPSDSVGRIEVARRQGRLPEGLSASGLVALLDLCSGNGISKAARRGRAGGRDGRLCI
ncbi:hypothetical protein, partial [Achromobacter insuavis]|uniref:hypothetical protein n=1 Tax=Achromobacter insuavis TaxID=1287735 RepID=UPI001F14505C